MKIIVKITLNLLGIPLMLAVLYLCSKAFVSHVVVQQSSNLNNFLNPLFVGLILGVSLRVILSVLSKIFNFKNPLAFIDTLEHELTHALFGYLTFSPPDSLLATSNTGGEVTMSRTNVLIVLSPYFFPLFAFVSLGLSFIIHSAWVGTWRMFIFFLLGSFIFRLMTELRWYQTDLKVYGRFFSFAFILLMLFVSMSLFLNYCGWISFSWTSQIPLEFRELRDLVLAYI